VLFRSGKEKDKLTDFYYFEARYYDSGFEHFTQADSVEPNFYDPQDLNKYAYVRNNPLKYIDPTGQTWWNPFTWFKKSGSSVPNSNSTSSNVAVVQPTTESSKLPQVSTNSKPLDNMKQGGYGFDVPGLPGVRYARGKGVTPGYHNGLDLKASPTDKVYAPEKVTIMNTHYDKYFGQLSVDMKGESGLSYRFVHMTDNPDLRKGVTIYAGNPIGTVGDAKFDKWADGPHLHISVLRGDTYINPSDVFEYEK
jgi:RHS repeat-associated protein